MPPVPINTYSVATNPKSGRRVIKVKGFRPRGAAAAPAAADAAAGGAGARAPSNEQEEREQLLRERRARNALYQRERRARLRLQMAAAPAAAAPPAAEANRPEPPASPLRIRRPEQPPEAPPLPGIQARQSEDDAPGSPVSPIPPHINDYNHQLYNIHRPIQGLYDIIRSRDEEARERQQERAAFQENRHAGSSRSPWSRIKPLKPNALDEYDRNINAQRAMQRRWVKVDER